MRAKQKLIAALALIMVVSFGFSGLTVAEEIPQSSSSNYSVDEVFFGSGGALHNCSTNYCAKQAAGETTVGNTSSSNYQAQTGFNSNRAPFIQFVVNNPNTDLGLLTSSAAKTATATFSVKTYLASGYNVVQTSPGPINAGHVMTSPTTPTASTPGTEQFGINLAANTDPTTFGAGPAQNPDATFSYGQVSPNYATANKYMYQQGDIIAYGNQSSGETDYTISYIFNISNITPGGQYVLNHVLVATSTF